tara:strand:- start:1029 stop:1325 length:297 start_codon:yes stop_codon:yes gene_type:complete
LLSFSETSHAPETAIIRNPPGDLQTEEPFFFTKQNKQKTNKISLLRRTSIFYLSAFSTIRAMSSSSSIKTGKPERGTEGIMSKKKHGTCMAPVRIRFL